MDFPKLNNFVWHFTIQEVVLEILPANLTESFIYLGMLYTFIFFFLYPSPNIWYLNQVLSMTLLHYHYTSPSSGFVTFTWERYKSICPLSYGLNRTWTGKNHCCSQYSLAKTKSIIISQPLLLDYSF